MEPCVKLAAVSGVCVMCGRQTEKMHRPLFHRGSFCPLCCPVCARKPVKASTAAPRQANPEAQGTSQWKDGGWGPHPDDPWYREDERRDSALRWVPARPKWFR